MRKVLSFIIIFVLSCALFDDVILAQKSDSPPEKSDTTVIDLTADIVYPITLNDTVEVMCLVGNFAAQHNGAIITADSAVRYSDKRLECYGNVLINKNTTYAYADRADYNGEINEVNLYAPIVKVIDGEATLYCYNFRFNTLDNIGSYVGGGVMINGQSVMESVVGYYYSDNKELIGVGDVELSGDEYEMKSDSVIYNTESENAIYFKNTNIWNQEDEYLYADAGDYDKALDRYSFSLNGYILTDDQEMWSDSMDYFRASEHIYMRHNIQIDDTVHKSLIFGDFGEYVKTPGDMILVGRPSIINYDAEQGDSLFMRADTFEIFTLNRFDGVQGAEAPVTP
ncbi:MAG: OstA-like protein, partial [Rikenellaceae bacterium]